LTKNRDANGLTPAREIFAQAVAGGMSLRDAFIKSHPHAARWKIDGLHVKASQMNAEPAVQARIAAIQAEASERTVLKLVDVLEETRRIMLSTPAGIIDAKTGKVKLPHELDPATAAAVASFEIDDLGRIRYKFWDKNASLERAAKILGAFKKDNEQQVDPLAKLLATLAGNVFRPNPAAAKAGEDDEP
jgi:hypothetical protein